MAGFKGCDNCSHYIWDEYEEYYYCDIDLDEDDMVRFLKGTMEGCPHFNLDDEYAIVRKQN